MSFYLGEAMPAEINYKNKDFGRKIVVENPAKSFEIYMHVLDSASQEE